VVKLFLVAQAFLPVSSLNTASKLTDRNVCATEAKKFYLLILLTFLKKKIHKISYLSPVSRRR
jgi:hypothetical protein